MSTQTESNSLHVPAVHPKPSDVTVSFMLSELQRLSERWSHGDESAESRLNLYITITSGVSAVLLLLSQLKVTSYDFLVVALPVFAIVWLLGLLFFLRMLRRILTVVGYIRAINRLRRFFVDNDLSIERYVALPITDSEPKYVSYDSRFGIKTVTAAIGSLAFGLLLGDAYSLLVSGSQVLTQGIIVGIVASIAHLVILEAYSTIRLNNAERAYKVQFPPR